MMLAPANDEPRAIELAVVSLPDGGDWLSLLKTMINKKTPLSSPEMLCISLSLHYLLCLQSYRMSTSCFRDWFSLNFAFHREYDAFRQMCYRLKKNCCGKHFKKHQTFKLDHDTNQITPFLRTVIFEKSM
jgi:hypothetical protein